MTEYYDSILSWIQNSIKDLAKPVLIGVSAPQGAGKTTLTTALVKKLRELSLNAVTISIDDFYLTRAEQVTLAQKYSNNPLMQQRGYPGTHDVALGDRILKQLKNIAETKTVLCPVYDKSAYQGLGDRAPESQWKKISYPLDVIFLEGWMLGFPPLADSDLPDENFRQMNSFLPSYNLWTSKVDAFIHIVPNNIQNIVQWRIEAEEKMKASGKPGMTTAEVTAYIMKFIKAYELYLPQLSCAILSPRQLRFTIGPDRMPVNPIEFNS